MQTVIVRIIVIAIITIIMLIDFDSLYFIIVIFGSADLFSQFIGGLMMIIEIGMGFY